MGCSVYSKLLVLVSKGSERATDVSTTFDQFEIHDERGRPTGKMKDDSKTQWIFKKTGEKYTTYDQMAVCNDKYFHQLKDTGDYRLGLEVAFLSGEYSVHKTVPMDAIQKAIDELRELVGENAEVELVLNQYWSC
jgi:hypothetical protein